MADRPNLKKPSELDDAKTIIKLRKTVRPFEDAIKIPDSVSPDKIKLLLDTAADRKPEVYDSAAKNGGMMRRIIACAAGFAVVLTTVLSAVIISGHNNPVVSVPESSVPTENVGSSVLKNDGVKAPEELIISDNDGLQTDINYTSSRGEADYSSESASENTGNVNDYTVSGNDIPAPSSPGYSYSLPSGAVYLDGNRSVYSTSNDSYSAIVDRISFLKSNSYINDSHSQSLNGTGYGEKGFADSQFFGVSDITASGDIDVYGDGILYSLDPSDSVLSIADFNNGGRRCAVVPLDTAIGYASYSKLYLCNDILAVIYSKNVHGGWRTCVTFFNIENPYSPMVLRSFAQEGYTVSSSFKDGRLYLVSSRSVGDLGLFNPDDYTDYVPAIIDTNYSSKLRHLVPASRIIILNTKLCTDYIVISGINMLDMSEEAYSYAMLGDGSCIKSGADSVFIASTNYNDKTAKTNLVSIELGQKVVLNATAVLAGSVFDGSVMSIINGRLCIVTESSADSGAYLSLFNSSLDRTGYIENLYKNIGIDSVDFFGSAVYLTKRGTGLPLVIDCADMSSPTILGTMYDYDYCSKVYYVNEKYYIGITEKVVNGINSGFYISLYNFVDKRSPVLIDRLEYSGERMITPLLSSDDEYAGISFSSDRSEFSVPVQIMYQNSDRVSFCGAYVFDISSGYLRLKSKITGSVPIDDLDDSYLTISSDKFIRRCIFEGEKIVAASRFCALSFDSASGESRSCYLRDWAEIDTLYKLYYGFYFTQSNVVSPGSYGVKYSADYFDRAFSTKPHTK